MEISESAWAKAKEIIYKDRYVTPTWELLARAIDQERRECAEIAQRASVMSYPPSEHPERISQAIRNK